MQQFMPISVPPSSSQGAVLPAGSVSRISSDETALGSHQAMNGKGFGKVFQTVTHTSGEPVNGAQVMTWDEFSQQYPDLMEQLGEGFDPEAFFAQFQFDGQSLTLNLTHEGEFLPPGLSGDVNGILGQMTAWVKQAGIELTLDESGQIVPVQLDTADLAAASEKISGESALALNHAESGKDLMAKITDAVNQFVANVQADPKANSGGFDKSVVDLETKIPGLQLGHSVAQGAQVRADSAGVINPVLGATVPAGSAVTAESTNGASVGLLNEPASTQTGQQGFSNQGGGQQGQNETDAQFKALLGNQLSEGVADESADPLLTKVSESSGAKFSEIQSKIQGAALKQYSTGVSTPVTDPEWTDQMGQKIVWMTGQKIQAAEIHLNPAELGPVEVKISVQNEQAAITFNVQHATVRELLESNVQRLREMMESNGVELADVDVSDDQSRERYAANDGEDSSGQGGSSSGDLLNDDGDIEEVTVQEGPVGLVDYYA